MRRSKRQILVVDDDKLIVSMLSDILSAEFEVVTASDGEGAIELLRSTPVAAVLSDQNMPGKSGVEVLSEALERQPKAVRILVTATDSVKDVADATNLARVHRVVVKPVREVEIAGIVQGAIHEAELEEENRRLVAELRQAVTELQEREVELERELQARNEELRMVINRFKSGEV